MKLFSCISLDDNGDCKVKEENKFRHPEQQKISRAVNLVNSKENVNPESSNNDIFVSNKERKVIEWLEKLDTRISPVQIEADEEHSLIECHQLEELNKSFSESDLFQKKSNKSPISELSEVTSQEFMNSVNHSPAKNLNNSIVPETSNFLNNKKNVVILQNMILSTGTVGRSIAGKFTSSTTTQTDKISISSDILAANSSSLSKVTATNCAISKVEDFYDFESEVSNLDDLVRDPDYSPTSSLSHKVTLISGKYLLSN